MTLYRVTIAEEVYYTFEIEAASEQAPNTFRWNPEAIALRDKALRMPANEAVEVSSEFIDYLEIEEA